MHLVGVQEEEERAVGVRLDPARAVGEDRVDLAAVDEVGAPPLGVGREAAREAGVGPNPAVLGEGAREIAFAPEALGEELDRRRRRRMKLVTPCSLGKRELKSDMCEPLVSGHTDHASVKTTASRAKASICGMARR